MNELFKKADALVSDIKLLEAQINDCEIRFIGLEAPGFTSAYVRDIQKQKKKGNIWLGFGVFFFILEAAITGFLLYGVQAGIIANMPEGLIGIWLWFSAPLIVGIIRKINGLRKYKAFVDKHGSIEEALTKCADQEQHSNAIQTELNALKSKLFEKKAALDDLVGYHGKDWDFSTFHGDASSVAALEKDFKALLIALKYKERDTAFVTNCWLAKNELRASTATYTGDKDTQEKYDRGSQAIRESGSWILQIINAVNITLTMEILMGAMGTKGEGIPFPEALERTKVREPENQEEQVLWDLAHEVIPGFAFTVGWELRKAVKNQ